METTYSHLSSDEHNTSGHRAFGVSDAGDGGDETPPWDSTCTTCHRVLHPGVDVCEECGTERGRTPWDDPEPKPADGIEGRIKGAVRSMYDDDEINEQAVDAQASALAAQVEQAVVEAIGSVDPNPPAADDLADE